MHAARTHRVEVGVGELAGLQLNHCCNGLSCFGGWVVTHLHGLSSDHKSRLGALVHQARKPELFIAAQHAIPHPCTCTPAAQSPSPSACHLKWAHAQSLQPLTVVGHVAVQLLQVLVIGRLGAPRLAPGVIDWVKGETAQGILVLHLHHLQASGRTQRQEGGLSQPPA